MNPEEHTKWRWDPFWLWRLAQQGRPLVWIPIVVPIEVVSFLSRPISLSVRLAANMLAGHTMLKVFAGFVVTMLGAGGIMSAAAIRRFGITPKAALVSHSNFGSRDSESARKMREALQLVREQAPDLEVDGEMHGESAISEAFSKRSGFTSTVGSVVRGSHDSILGLS